MPSKPKILLWFFDPCDMIKYSGDGDHAFYFDTKKRLHCICDEHSKLCWPNIRTSLFGSHFFRLQNNYLLFA